GPPSSRSHPAPAGVTFRRAGLRDLKRLLPLQAAYEEEEVIVDGREVNSSVVYHNMRSALEHHLTYIAERDDVPIAKASTNARGLTYDQIGGVYTIPAERNRGVAGELMRYLLADIREQGKRATLFVKQHNEAARVMYEHLGFEHRNEFAISYYTS
ncbi:MAG: GNAT family N-acetyltransferase, partial [Spirochaetota bacterium]